VLYQLSYVSNTFSSWPAVPATRAGDGARTRDIKLGRLALYQLSYSRVALPLPTSHYPSLLSRYSLHFARTITSHRMVGEGFEPS
jgi:hypothetical protein